MESLSYELRQAFRALRKRRGYSLVVVLTLGIGIGAATTIFSLAQPFLFRPLPFGNPDELVQVYQVDRETGWGEIRLSFPQYRDWRERSEAFDDMAAYDFRLQNITGDGEPERVQVARVTANMLSVLRTRPQLGRDFSAGEDEPGARRVALLHNSFWRNRFGQDTTIIGRDIWIDGVPHTVIGIMPPDFHFPFGEVKLWTPLRADPVAEDRARNRFLVVGRLDAGWSIEQAERELSGVQQQLAELYPNIDGEFAGANVQPIRAALIFNYDMVTAIFLALLGTAALVLLIVCTNVGGLTLARVIAHRHVLSIRAAIGAGRRRLVQQLLAEGLLLAVAGGVVGVALAMAGVRVLANHIPVAIFRVGTISVDGTALGFAAFVSLLTPFLFGLAPAWQVRGVDVADALREAGRGQVTGRRGWRLRRGLVVAEVALATVLVTSAGLMLRSVLSLQQVDLGFEPDSMLTFQLTLPEAEYAEPGQSRAFYDELLGQLRGIPAVRSVATVDPLPLVHENPTVEFNVPDAEVGARHPRASRILVSPGALSVLGVSLLRGSGFSEGAQGAVIINHTMAERYWPKADPVGRQIRVGTGAAASAYTVIGVAADVRIAGVENNPGPQIYLPQTEHMSRGRWIVVRTDGTSAQLTSFVRGAVARLDSDLPVSFLRPMNDVVRSALSGSVLSAGILGVFAAVALFLAGLGIYGVIAHSVAERTREFGVRRAFGASEGRIRRLVLGEGMKLVLIGLICGALLAAATGRALDALLYRVSPSDPATLALVVLAFLVTGLVALLVPAFRATRTHPVDALRSE